MPDMSVRDVFSLATLMGLYLSPASGHQKAYKELLAYVDAGHALTLDDVQHAMIWYSRPKPNRGGVAKKRTFFFQRDFTFGPKPFFFGGCVNGIFHQE